MMSYLASHTLFDTYTHHTQYATKIMAHILPFNPQTTTITPTCMIDRHLAVTLTLTLTLRNPIPNINSHSNSQAI